MRISPLHTIFIAIFLLLGSQKLMATHNRAGEITYVQTGDLSIEVTISTYTKASSVQADRDSLTVDWGDGTTTRVARVNGGGNGELLPNDLKHNIYKGSHVYPGRTTYTISFQDPNRIGGIRNVDFPNSISVPFYVETTFSFLNPQFQGYNNSVILDNAPIDEACLGRRFEHNPGAYDTDGDSLAYELATPMQAVGEVVPKYEFPDEIVPGTQNNLTFNERTGDLVWESPQLAGEYNIAIKIKEFRNGVLINTVVRDMQINVKACNDSPPIVLATSKLCVVAGERIQKDVFVTDPDEGDKVRLFASGGPFLTKYNKAQIIGPDSFVNPALEAIFLWQTACSHISNTPYVTIFKGQDNFFDHETSATGLVDLFYMETYVSGPAPQNVTTTRVGNTIALDWEYRYRCDTAKDDYFKGFTIWRKKGSTDVPLDTCGTDLERYGYEEIAYVQNDTLNGRYHYVDEKVEKGLTYCYRITAEFSLTSPGGYPYNRVQSLPSEETCQQLARDIPLINHVSVTKTDASTGEIMVAWLPPLAEDLDTLNNPPPYHIDVARGTGFNNNIETVELRKTYASFSALNRSDTVFIQDLNTENQAHHFQLNFYTENNNLYGKSQEASSVFLESAPANEQVTLNWNFDVPWSNISYTIFEVDKNTMTLDSIGSTTETSFTIKELMNGEEYCFAIEALGTYSIPNAPNNIKNRSQQICTIPLDTLPPCQAKIDLKTSCDDEDFDINDIFSAEINWSYPSCSDSSDIEKILIYFSPSGSTDSILILETTDISVRSFTYEMDMPQSGCFFIVTQDFADNKSISKKNTCIEACPIYQLPNTFTPNGDNSNDIFQPYPYRFITSVNFKVFTRWGNLVFETTNPDINWDGNDIKGKELEEDTYFYTCEAFSNAENDEQNTLNLSGYITLIRD